MHRKSLPTATAQVLKDKLSFSSSEAWCLLIHLPFIFGDLVSESFTEHWEGIITLIKITHLVFSNVLDYTDIDILESLIQKFLSSIKYVFKTTIIPKMHFLTHYPSVIKKLGPSAFFSTMRFESKHK